MVQTLCKYYLIWQYVKQMLRRSRRREIIDREFVTSAKKFANFNEFSEIRKKNR